MQVGVVMYLTPRQREIFTLRCDQGFTPQEAAESLGIAEGTVKELCRLAYRRNDLVSAEQVCYRLGQLAPAGTLRPEAV